MTFASQIGPLPYSWRIVSGTAVGMAAVLQIELADASGTVHPIPDADGNPQPTFAVQIPFDPTVDVIGLIAEQARAVERNLWEIEAGSAEAVLPQIIAQNYRKPI